MSVQSLGSVTIVVDAQQLKAKANEVTRRITQMERLFTDMETTIQQTQGYWIGEAGNHHRQVYLDHKDELNQMFTRLKEHPRDLLEISGNYEAAESEIQSMVAELSANAIQ